MAFATITESIKIRPEEIAMYKPKYQVSPAEFWEFYEGKEVYAWPHSDVVPVNPPIKYQHPGGGSWVSLTPTNVAEWNRLQEASSREESLRRGLAHGERS